MSEFDKEYISDSSENSDAVEAFEDFEMTAQEVEAAQKAVEKVEAAAEEEAEDATEEIQADEDTAEEVDATEEATVAEEMETDEDTAQEVEEAEAETEEAVEEIEADEDTAEEAETADAVEEIEADEDTAEEAETEDAAEEIEANEDTAEEAEAEDAAEEIEADEETETADAVEEAEEVDTAEEIEEVEEVEEEYPVIVAVSDSTEDVDEETEKDDESDTEEVDEDDYLDYNDDPRPKKLVSGKTAVITMLTACLVTICVIAGAFWLGVTMKKDIGVSVVSYTDRFNACDTQTFTLGQLMGIDLISMSDADYTLSAKDISDFKNGQTIKKFSNLVNIQANTRFGKIVSMDITFDPALNDLANPSAMYMVLLGNAMSGLYENVNNSDTAFVAAYNALVSNCYLAPKKGSDVYMYTINDIAIYADYSKMAKTGLRSDVTIHIENKNPDIINPEKLDFSWIPFNFSSDKKASEGTASPSDVSPSEK